MSLTYPQKPVSKFPLVFPKGPGNFPFLSSNPIIQIDDLAQATRTLSGVLGQLSLYAQTGLPAATHTKKTIMEGGQGDWKVERYKT